MMVLASMIDPSPMPRAASESAISITSMSSPWSTPPPAEVRSDGV
jgi:hypothetical protein